MTADQYVELVVSRYAVDCATGSKAERATATLIPSLREWAGDSLLGISFSGSYAKGTAITLGTDVDLFLSLEDRNEASMKEIYWSLFSFLKDKQFAPVARNVAVGVEWDGVKVDLVPGRSRVSVSGDRSHLSRKERGEGGAPTLDNPHTLYRRKADSWMQTNVGEHIKLVSGSGRTAEIRALKIWREQNKLDFPSFYLELTTLEALPNRRSGLGENVMAVLEYLSERLAQAVVVDPANSNNVVSDELTITEKRAVAAAARKSMAIKRWELILW